MSPRRRAGATAGLALVGPGLRVTAERGRARPGRDGFTVVPTVHPSSILRAPDPEARSTATEAFVADLRTVRSLVGGA